VNTSLGVFTLINSCVTFEHTVDEFTDVLGTVGVGDDALPVR
jgi:hypothetical protein